MLKLYGLTVFFILNGLLCFLNLPDTTVFFTFILNLVCITIGFYRSVSNKNLNLDVIIWFFVYTFFFLAPVVQLNYNGYFPNTMPIELNYVEQANLLLLVWNVIYLLFRKKRKISELNLSESAFKFKTHTILDAANWELKMMYFVLSLVIFSGTFALFKMRFFLGYADYNSLISEKSLKLIIGIAFSGIVFANWTFAFAQIKRTKNIGSMLYVIISSIFLIYYISPFNSSRFYIGFSLILVIYTFYHKKVTSGTFILCIFVGLFMIFPFLNMFRFGFNEIAMPSLNQLMFNQLTELHFDAFSNIVATLKYCEDNGLAYGYQMLGVLFFFVPRSLWLAKPISSGEALGNYISSHYALKFNNLSDPIMSEFYINFGWIGVIGGALLMAFIVNRFELNLKTDRYTYALIAGYLFMIYRGDLMSAFAYSIGTYFIMVFIPVRITRVLESRKEVASVIKQIV